MTGTKTEGSKSKDPKDFNECVSQTQLQAALDKVQEGLGETITKAVNDAFVSLNFGNQIEDLHKRLSTLTDKVTELETCVTRQEEEVDDNTVEGDANNNARREARLRQRLRHNTIGMGGNQYHRPGNNERAPDDPYAKIKLTIPSLLAK